MWNSLVGEWLLGSGLCTLALGAGALSVLYVWYMRSFMTAWEGLGIKPLKYEFYYGHSRAAEGKTFVAYMEDLFRRHGKSVASYSLTKREPTLSTYDVRLFKHLLVKDFGNFVDRGMAMKSKSNMMRGLFFIGGQDWKRIRTLLSPIFSSGKLKLMIKHVGKTGEALGTHLAKKAQRNENVDVKRDCGHYASELIATLGFGVNPNAVGRDDDCEFTMHTKGLLNVSMPARLIYLYAFGITINYFPFFLPLLQKLGFGLDNVSPEADRYFTGALEEAIRRKKSQVMPKYPDILDFMLNTESDVEVKGALAMTSPKAMTHEEVMGQSKLLVFAAYETTSTTLSMVLYHLARFTEIQDKVLHEIQNVVQGDAPTSEELSQLKYTEQVINETLRLFPPLKTISRVCQQTRSYEGFPIPARTEVTFHIWKVHRSPEHWDDPEIFNPDRFSEEEKAKRDPLTFIPFGYGPRLCIGQRLAYMEIKVGIVNILRKVKLFLNENTVPKIDDELEMSDTFFVIPKNPILLACASRD